MGDAMDLVQQRVDETLAQQIKQATNRPVHASVLVCECGEPIPAARLAAIDSVTLCVACQEISELKSKHYRGAL